MSSEVINVLSDLNIDVLCLFVCLFPSLSKYLIYCHLSRVPLRSWATVIDVEFCAVTWLLTFLFFLSFLIIECIHSKDYDTIALQMKFSVWIIILSFRCQFKSISILCADAQSPLESSGFFIE
jgi:hypothetical protein